MRCQPHPFKAKVGPHLLLLFLVLLLQLVLLLLPVVLLSEELHVLDEGVLGRDLRREGRAANGRRRRRRLRLDRGRLLRLGSKRLLLLLGMRLMG